MATTAPVVETGTRLSFLETSTLPRNSAEYMAMTTLLTTMPQLLGSGITYANLEPYPDATSPTGEVDVSRLPITARMSASGTEQYQQDISPRGRVIFRQTPDGDCEIAFQDDPTKPEQVSTLSEMLQLVSDNHGKIGNDDRVHFNRFAVLFSSLQGELTTLGEEFTRLQAEQPEGNVSIQQHQNKMNRARLYGNTLSTVIDSLTVVLASSENPSLMAVVAQSQQYVNELGIVMRGGEIKATPAEEILPNPNQERLRIIAEKIFDTDLPIELGKSFAEVAPDELVDLSAQDLVLVEKMYQIRCQAEATQQQTLLYETTLEVIANRFEMDHSLSLDQAILKLTILHVPQTQIDAFKEKIEGIFSRINQGIEQQTINADQMREQIREEMEFRRTSERDSSHESTNAFHVDSGTLSVIKEALVSPNYPMDGLQPELAKFILSLRKIFEEQIRIQADLQAKRMVSGVGKITTRSEAADTKSTSPPKTRASAILQEIEL